MMDYKEMPQLGDLNIPYYVQIYDIIYQLIQDEKLKEGDSLPGENILAEYWNVSRSTVRMAVRKLEEDGYIYKMQGKRPRLRASWPGTRMDCSILPTHALSAAWMPLQGWRQSSASRTEDG